MTTTKRDLVEQINLLEKQEQEDVFHILHRHGVFFSSNINGIFINMKHVGERVIDEINEFLDNLRARKERIASITDNFENRVEEIPFPPIVVKDEGGSRPPLGEAPTMDLTCGLDIQLSSEELDILTRFCNNIRCDRAAGKRGSNSRFSIAKKKYSRAPDVQTSSSSRVEEYLNKQTYAALPPYKTK